MHCASETGEHNDIFLTDTVSHDRLKFSSTYTPKNEIMMGTPLLVMMQ